MSLGGPFIGATCPARPPIRAPRGNALIGRSC